jgi:hypothetical protein
VVSTDPTCVLAVDEELDLALEAAFGPPIDSYLNGWQVWLEPCELRDADGERIELEYRLHTPAGYAKPEGVSHHDVWDEVVTQLAAGTEPLRLGAEERRLDQIWRLLEVYPAFGDDLRPEELREQVEVALGRDALAVGYVDHGMLGARWKRTRGSFDLAGALLDELGVSD